jgi:hypothetical protein
MSCSPWSSSMMRIRSRSTLRPRTCSNIRLGIEDIREVWASDPIFTPPNHPPTG